MMKVRWKLVLVFACVVMLLSSLFPVLAAGKILGMRLDGIGAPNDLPQGNNFLISNAEGTLRGQAAIAYNDDLDEYLVVWMDGRANTTSWDIYGQIVTGSGTPKGGTFVIRNKPSNALWYPEVAYDTVNERYLVVWQDFNGYDVEGRILNSDGSAYGAGFVIASGTLSDMRGVPAVAFHPQNGEYFVVYEGGAAGDHNIYGRRVSASGLPGATEYPICTVVNDQTAPDISVDPSSGGDFLIVWQDGRAASGVERIYGNIMNSTWFLDPEFLISFHATDGRYNPTVAFSPNAGTEGEWLVVFHREVAGDDQIAARRVTAAGATIGTQIQVCTDANDQKNPDVAYNADKGMFLVVWEDYRASPTNADVYGRGVDDTGNTMGDVFMIHSAANYQYYPVVAATPSASGFLVAWDDSLLEQIAGQHVVSAGMMGTAFTISAPLDEQERPAMAFNSVDGEFLAVWQDHRSGNWDIWGQRMSLDGLPLDESFPIYTGAESQRLPDVAYNLDTNQYLVVWEDHRTDADIYGQRVHSDGTLDGGDFGIAGSGATARLRPKVTFNPISGEFFVVYVYETENNNIRGRRVPPAAVPAEAEIDIATGTADQSNPDVATRTLEPGDGSYLVVWRETEGAQSDVRGQRIDQTGALQGTPLDICTEAHDQWAPKVAYSPESDRFLVAWPDERNSTTQERDVYGGQVSGAGSLYDEFAISTADGDKLHLAVGYSSALSSFAVIWQDTRLATSEPDLFGQCVSASGTLPRTQVGYNELVYSGLYAQEYPAVAWDQSVMQGVVAWQDNRAGDTDNHIYGLLLGTCEVFRDVSVTLAGAGTGIVSIVPPATDCSSGTCTETLVESTEITLTATGDAGSRFVGWDESGPCASETSQVCTFTLDASYAVTANFDIGAMIYLPLIQR